jgi:methyl acetate hydrolase
VTAEISEVLRSAVARDDVPGVVALAAREGGVVYEGAAGRRAADAEDPITPDTMLQIASMTKMITTAAALQLWEQGSLDLDARVRDYRPEFAALQVLEGFNDGNPRLRPPRAQASVRQLMTHTAGLAYWFWNADINRYEQVTGTPNVLSGSDAGFTAPLVADPGIRFEYGTSIDWLGRVVETVSGQPLDAYIRDHITGPLGMTSTTALMTAEQRANSAPVHVRDGDGSWTVTGIDWPQRPDFWGGGHFLYSSPVCGQRRLGGGFQHLFLGGPGDRYHRGDLLPGAAVRRACRARNLRGLRAGALRLLVAPRAELAGKDAQHPRGKDAAGMLRCWSRPAAPSGRSTSVRMTL